jgi:molybdopterin-guanine dinucleotide biosynthesis protein A
VQDNPVFGLVLAGGESRRMGQDKALLDNNGRSQLAFVVDLLGAVVDKVFISTRSDQAADKERARYEQIIDRFDNSGPVAGILSALEEHPDVDWLVVACDLPNIDEQTIRYLLDRRSDTQPFTAFTSSHDGLPEPLCAVYRKGCKNIVQTFVDDGMICPRKILIRSDTCLLEQPNAAALDNVNTPDDLHKSILQVG